MNAQIEEEYGFSRRANAASGFRRIADLTELRQACDQGTDPWWAVVAADIDAELDRREVAA